MFSKNLKIHRLKKNYSQEKLADLTGTTVVTISNYERGESWPTRENLALIIDALEVSPYELFIDTEHELDKVKLEFKEQFDIFIESLDERSLYGNRHGPKKRARKLK